MTPLPSLDQIRHARTLLSSRVFGPATVARLTGVPLRAVFRINRTLPKDQPFPKKRLVQ